MVEKPRKPRPDRYDAYREASGWWLAAWRDYRGLTLETLAEAMGVSRGYCSDLETGATRPGRPGSRYNRDHVEKAAVILGVNGGRLIDTNPYAATCEDIQDVFVALNAEDQKTVRDLAMSLVRRREEARAA